MMRFSGKGSRRSSRDRLTVTQGTVACPLTAGPINVERCLGCSSFRGRGAADEHGWIRCRGDRARLLAEVPPA